MRKILTLRFIILLTLLLGVGCNEQPENQRQQVETEESAIQIGEIIDLTHTFSEETIYWVTAKEFHLDTVAYGQTEQGYFYSANNFETAEHGGTHLDAPIHFSEGKQSVDEIPLEKLIGHGIKIDVRKSVGDNADYLISVDDLTNWETENGQIPENSIVLLETGFAKFYPDRKKYMGTEERGTEAIAQLHFPGLSPEAARWLVENRNISAIGLDTPSIDNGQSTNFESHVILLSENIPAFENLTNLDKLPHSGFTVVALPMKIKGGSGAPLRIVALLN